MIDNAGSFFNGGMIEDLAEGQPTWPDAGSGFHHSLGFGITRTRDATSVLRVDEPRRLTLQTGMGPLGANRIMFRLLADPDGTGIELDERPAVGLVASKGPAPAVDRPIWLRTHGVLRRVRQLAGQDVDEPVWGRRTA